jgi:hypothetical protein
MNPRRAKVAIYSSDEKLNELALSLLSQLLFCTEPLESSAFGLACLMEK